MKGDGRCLKLFLALSILFLQKVKGGEVGHSHSHSLRDAKVAVRCIERERQALLAFKRGLVDKFNYLSSWGSEAQKQDCCRWEGVYCSNQTGHVIQLDLPSPDIEYSFQGKMISPKLIELQHLQYLHLASIDFNESQIPDFIGSLTNLRSLIFSSCNLAGQIPSSFGNLTQLQYINLSYNQLRTENLNWLPALSSLTYLDLAFIDFNGSQIPDFIGSLTNLRNLDLHSCNLVGQIPSSFGNLTQLQYLDLTNNSLSGFIPNCIGNMSSLVDLDLSNNYLTGFIPDFIGNMSSLVDLDLSNNYLTGFIPDFIGNMSSLVNLDLSNNNLTSFIHDFTGNMSSLVSLDLSNNNLTGFIPDFTGNMSSLVHLDLSNNNLTGFIPDFTGNMSSLLDMDLSDNQIEGANPNSFARLCNLQTLELQRNHLSGQLSQLLPRCAQNSLMYLDLSENVLKGSLNNLTSFSSLRSLNLSMNSLEGVVSETHFSKLSDLNELDLSYNSLVLNFHFDWVPPFQLSHIYLASCTVGPLFPKWLQTQNKASLLDISNAGISDILPSWFWSHFRNAYLINLSQNLIRGIFTNLTVEFTYNLELHLSSNQIEGPIPSTLSQASYLDLSNNKISGSLSFLCESAYLNLTFLNLSSNNFYGDLPDCWSHLAALVMLDLSNNAFSGKIPMTIGSLWRIETLKLRSNRFVGEFPSSLKNCTRLQVIDLGDNELSGSIPKWLGVSLKNLAILMLSSNHFNGSMPSQLCHLTRIQILDFSVNNISGSIPKCLINLTAMAQKGNSSLTSTHSYTRGGNLVSRHATGSHGILLRHNDLGIITYEDDVRFMWKGRMQTYKSTLGLVKRIDLSSNRLIGEIPTEITHLVELVSLNLSRNRLTGQITPEIGNLQSLDSLDLSRNQIDGRIPTSLARIYRLSFLDLSYNNLSGKIPTSTQLQSFEFAYAGNPQLCGSPLKKMCANQNEPLSNEEDTDEFITLGFYISMGIGFAAGFWGVCGTLIFNRSWRYAYLKFLNGLNDWLYVKIALSKRQLKLAYA
ncbi:hypothetical protein L3X38_011675 [Prunus dulcis]|uniref:Disease resistance family protein / LRR family protein n=1 Tax=Prunus dulcis TaxID=3755 RepID=A0AAD4WI73_PRUDU|nr:hypothetical protein L3X38_011675 [Prunus dulcis]